MTEFNLLASTTCVDDTKFNIYGRINGQDEANEFCLSRGATLGPIFNVDEFNLVRFAILDQIENLFEDLFNGVFFIGLDAINVNRTGIETDPSVFTFTSDRNEENLDFYNESGQFPWLFVEPNRGDDVEDCAILRFDDQAPEGLVFDNLCVGNLNFVCRENCGQNEINFFEENFDYLIFGGMGVMFVMLIWSLVVYFKLRHEYIWVNLLIEGRKQQISINEVNQVRI